MPYGMVCGFLILFVRSYFNIFILFVQPVPLLSNALSTVPYFYTIGMAYIQRLLVELLAPLNLRGSDLQA